MRQPEPKPGTQIEFFLNPASEQAPAPKPKKAKKKSKPVYLKGPTLAERIVAFFSPEDQEKMGPVNRKEARRIRAKMRRHYIGQRHDFYRRLYRTFHPTAHWLPRPQRRPVPQPVGIALDGTIVSLENLPEAMKNGPVILAGSMSGSGYVETSRPALVTTLAKEMVLKTKPNPDGTFTHTVKPK